MAGGFRGLQELVWLLLCAPSQVVSIGPDFRATPVMIPAWGEAMPQLPDTQSTPQQIPELEESVAHMPGLDVASTPLPDTREAKEI